MAHNAAASGPHRRPARIGAAVASAGLLALTAACGGSGGQAPSARPSPAVPGRVSVNGRGADLTITNAVAHLDSTGSGELDMTVRNDGDSPQRLVMVATPGGGRGRLHGTKGKGNGSLASSGVLIAQDHSVRFSGGKPTVLLHHVHGVTKKHTLPLNLVFGVGGSVRLTAKVSRE